MNKNKNFSGSSFFRQTTLILLFVLVLPYALMANGKADYEDQLARLTEEIVTSIDNEEMTADQAKSQLSELRLQYRKEYTDESGRMDALCDDLENDVITSEQALGEMEQLRQRSQERKELLLEEQKNEEQKTQTQKKANTTNADSNSSSNSSSSQKKNGNSTGKN